MIVVGINEGYKFRVWVENVEEYYYFDLNNIGDVSKDFQLLEWSNMEKEQFTGFKDDNELDIYFGDIVEYTFEDGDDGDDSGHIDVDVLAEVTRTPCGGTGLMVNNEITDLWGDDLLWKKIVVVGNIRKNKLLYKETGNK